MLHRRKGWISVCLDQKLFRLCVIVWIAVFPVACGGEMKGMPDEVATLEKSSISPSGKYALVVVAGNDGSVSFQSFQILSVDGEVLYSSPDKFAMRHTTYFLWGEDDRVWVYSGDVGTFFWEYSADHSEWRKHIYTQSNVPAPEFLKEVRPTQHKK